mmetsp:Transcript_14581/g.35573  ORF Transcript_14581/g.35573 Transcript_14581/m.35573 type:complete len:678 (+) Transcript_14581:219-2252(+)
MKVSNINGVQIYHVSAGKTLPEFLGKDQNLASRKQSLRYNDAYRRRIELIQDFHFPTAANTLKISPDGNFLLACGTYKPQLKMYELSQLGMKFERHMDAQGTRCEFLSDDYRKFCLLRDDRFVEFHAQYGLHHKIRVPKFGRDMKYLKDSCDLLVAGASSEVYRLNLYKGQFVTSLQTALKGVNAIAENSVHGLVALAGESGDLECYDPRSAQRAAYLRIPESLARIDARSAQDVKDGGGISAVAFGSSALTMAVGTDSGHVLTYDIRAPAPIRVRDHRYGLPIKRLIFQPDKLGNGDERLFSADSKVIKIWKGGNQDGKLLTAIESPADINDFIVYKDSGLILAACESHKMHSWYIPEIGSAPRWCYYLDTLTEELQESDKTTVYEDYKFVTRDQLEEWGVSGLVGTEALRAYMHGFFIDLKLYRKIQSVADPYSYERFYEEKLKKKIEETRQSRIILNSQLPKVNKKLAKAILAHRKKETERRRKKLGDDAESKLPEKKPLLDQRFKAMFEDEDFQIDETSEHFARINPHKHAAAKSNDARGSIGAEEEPDSDDDMRNGALSILRNFEGEGPTDDMKEEEEEAEYEHKEVTKMYDAPSGYSARQLLQGKVLTKSDAISKMSLEERLKLETTGITNTPAESDSKQQRFHGPVQRKKRSVDGERRKAPKGKIRKRRR